MKVVLSGAGGFLGRAIVEELIKGEYEIIALTSQIEKCQCQYKKHENVRVIESIMYEQIDFSTVDFLISCAFPTNAEDGVAIARGLEYVCRLLNYANDTEVRHIIDISTQSVYGTQRKCKAKETTQINLDSKYAIGKYCTELMLDGICKNCALTHFRVASLLGPGFDQRIPNVLIERLMQKLPIRIVDGEQIWGYMDVRDAANAIVSSLPQLYISGGKEIYNIASEEYTLLEIIDTILKVGEENQITTESVMYEVTGKHRNTSVDASKFKKDFNWKAKYSLEDTIREIYKSKLETASKCDNGDCYEI